MSTSLRRAVPFIQPVLAILFLILWIASNSSSLVNYVDARSQTFSTNPYVVLVAVGIALAVALSRVQPIAAFSIVGGLLLIQTLFWPARFSQDAWDAYLVLPFVVLFGGAFGGRIFRWIALALSVVFAFAVSALLNLPVLSISGRFGTINGKPNSSPDIATGFWTWAVVAAGLSVGAWFLGRHLRSRRLATDAVAASTIPTGEFHDESTAIASLSEREKQIFLLAAEGRSNRDIATTASIEESTVKTHLNTISKKLGLGSRMELVAFAYREGVLAPAARS